MTPDAEALARHRSRFRLPATERSAWSARRGPFASGGRCLPVAADRRRPGLSSTNRTPAPTCGSSRPAQQAGSPSCPGGLLSLVGGDGPLVVVSDDGLYSIGQLAERTGLSVRTIRFYSDQGVVPATGRSAAGHRRYDVHGLARLDLVRTLRELGLPLSTIRAVLDNGLSLPQVAAAHARALDTQIDALRLRRAVLRAVAKRTTPTAEDARLMHQLAKMSDVERARLIQDFIDDTFGGLDANPEFVELLRAATPDLPADPTPDQVQAWVELAELVQDADFRASVRRMAEYQVQERADGDQTRLHHELTAYVRDTVNRAIDDGITPESPHAGAGPRGAGQPLRPDLHDRRQRRLPAVPAAPARGRQRPPG